tara:strand:+ start:2230 stop:3819 length:1590 start_codon:yes stop_codon:yes gene_type:complete
MITAVILARCNSSRLPNKHFYKIGNKEIINIIIDNLKKNKAISKIYLATGTEKKNSLFKKFINNKKLEIYFHKNESDVTGRICELTKQIKTKYTLLISGDCCLVDNNFIKRLYLEIKKQDSDFIKSKQKLIHEGITIFKTNIWKKVNKLSKYDYQKEHPGYVVKERPNMFNIGKYKPQKYELGKKFRLSVDTESDLDFFNAHYSYLQSRNKKFNLINVIKSKNYTYLNKHVDQKKVVKKNKIKYVILTTATKLSGLGHFSRSKTIFREINEAITADVKIICLGKKFHDNEFLYNNRIQFINKIDSSLFKTNNKIIIDLPQNTFKNISNNLINKKNIIIIDNYRNLKKPKFIIPTIRKVKINQNKNIYSGKDHLIISRKILKYNSNIKQTKNNYFLLGGSMSLSLKMINFLKDIKNVKLLVGPLIGSSEEKNLKKAKINYSVNKLNYFKDLSVASRIYCKFGVSAYEIILLEKKPIIFEENETNERKKDIKYLFDNGLIKLIRNEKIVSNKKKITLSIVKSLKNIINIIK